VWLAGAASQDAQNALVLAIVGIGGTLLVTIAAGLFQVWAAKQNRQQQVPENAQVTLFERTAVLSDRADDCDTRDETQDRRLDQIEKRLDLENPRWRAGDD
jgi:hypothetical protein